MERERDISKTSVEHFKPERVADLYALIEHHSLKGIFSVSSECDTLDVSPADYYAWRCSVETARQRPGCELIPLIADASWKHQRRYGARRIAVELIALGQPCGVDREANLMKNQGLRAIQPKSFVPKTTDCRHTLGYHPNLLLNAPPPQRMNQGWVSGIIYIPLQSGRFMYRALTMDLFSPRVLGWELAESLSEPVVLESLRQAIRSRHIRANER